jgi:hypothetical protein
MPTFYYACPAGHPTVSRFRREKNRDKRVQCPECGKVMSLSDSPPSPAVPRAKVQEPQRQSVKRKSEGGPVIRGKGGKNITFDQCIFQDAPVVADLEGGDITFRDSYFKGNDQIVKGKDIDVRVDNPHIE